MRTTLTPYRPSATHPFAAFDHLFGNAPRRSHTAGLGSYDAIRHEDRIELHFDLPGIDPDSVELTIDGRDLVLEATRVDELADDATVLRRGRQHGTVTRRLHLGENIATENLKADFDLGVLTVTLPLVAEATPRRIEIGASS